ncbi:MAG: GPR endopeptidase [Lachnospiraceae bacterium]|nr:GPR endopeptidase [Lachnospiraceae bacterium]
MKEKRTDLALEVRESFPRNHVEVKGVVLEKHYCPEGKAQITTVQIKDDAGSKAMKKPKGTYITIESELMLQEEEDREPLLLCICGQLEKIIKDLKQKSVLIVGLGNREVTSDSLGPKMTEHLFITRHLEKELGETFMEKNEFGCVSAISPGVMAQTGIETEELLESIVKKTKPDLVIAVDALAARSVKRLCKTIQITDTGIAPGAGVGNRRKELNKKSLGVPVVAIGVPTVVDAETIIGDHLEHVLEKQGYSEQEIEQFICEILTSDTENVMVTPKNIDASVNRISRDLADVLNHCFQKKG